MTAGLTASETLAHWLESLAPEDIPLRVRDIAANMLLDVAGLMISARKEDYTKSVIQSWDGRGTCTVFGQEVRMDAAGAALINGTTAHGEDFDDTFEGAPLHAGAAAIPAILAVCEQHGRSGRDALKGIVAAVETMGRLVQVAPGAIHRAGFQPASVVGCIGVAAGVGVALGFDRLQLTNAMGIAGSFSSGLMEFLAEGAWTKRIHPGWAGQSGIRAAALARAGFIGPRTMLEGKNGFYSAFARQAEVDVSPVVAQLGRVWWMENVAFKLYPCGTMIGPYIDCARQAHREGLVPEQIVRIDCTVSEAVAARQWEPLAAKQRPASGFAAKFSAPFGIALGIVEGVAGLSQYTDTKALDPRLRAVAEKVHFSIDPDNPFPNRYTGDLLVSLADGSQKSYVQPHLRGGRCEPISSAELMEKFSANIAHGGWSQERGRALAALCQNLFTLPDLSDLSRFGMEVL